MARLLHLISSNQRRGAETFASELAVDLRSRGHDVHLLAVEAATSGPYLDVEIAGTRRADPRGLARIVRAARAADLTISFGSSSLQAATIGCALARRPFVYRNIGDPGVWQSVRLSQLRVGLPLRRAARIVAVFPGAGDELVRRYGIDRARVRVIPRGVPADRFPVVTDDRRAAARNTLGLDPSLRWMVYVGSMSEEKEPMAAVKSVAQLDGVGLVMCGDGPLLDSLSSQRELPPERFVLLGPVDDVRVPLAAADALLLTSRTEGVPGAVVEAGLSGLPVVASDVGGLGHVVDDGRTGRLVAAGDIAGYAAAIREVLERRDELGAAAADHCRAAFSMASVGAAWHELIGEVSAGRHR